MSERIHHTVNIAIRAFLLFLLALATVQMVRQLIFHNSLLTIFGYSQVTVLTGSMEPTYTRGDMLINHHQDDYKVGDVITFWDRGELVTHRIVETADEGFITQGDANNTPDPLTVYPDKIVGKVVYAVPYFGNVFLFLRTPLGLLTFGAIIMVLILL